MSYVAVYANTNPPTTSKNKQLDDAANETEKLTYNIQSEYVYFFVLKFINIFFSKSS